MAGVPIQERHGLFKERKVRNVLRVGPRPRGYSMLGGGANESVKSHRLILEKRNRGST